MSPLNRSALAVAVVLFAALSAEGAKCRPNPSGKPWETRIIYLKFEGCPAAEPKEPFDLQVGGETVRFTKKGDGSWRGEATENFVIKTARLTFSLTSMRARTACNVAAEEDDRGQCIALYRIPCELLWRLNVKAVPDSVQAKIRYERPPMPAVFVPCAGEFRTEGSIVDLRESEEIVVKIEIPKGDPIAVPLSLARFGNGSLLRLTDVVPQANAADAAVGNNRAMRALKRGQIQRVLDDLLFTKQ